MPRVTKEAKDDELNKKKSTSKSSATTTKKKATTTNKTASTKTAAKKTTSTKKATTKATKSTTKKESTPVVEKKKEVKEKASKTTAKKATTAKKTTSSAKKKTSTTATKKVATAKKSTTTAKKKTTASTTKKKSTAKSKKLESNIVAEYYDLPYRYNETLVKILYQTPTILFVYWDISDYDRKNFVKQYGENFFNNTRPILKIFNLTKGYDFEIEINDFANSWYINVNDANCEYKVELARRTIRYEESINTDYIYISSSNDIEFPNDHILIDELPDKIRFKNVKTNAITTRDIGTMHLIGINRIYKAHDFYKRFYKDEILEEINSNKIINPSSSSWN